MDFIKKNFYLISFAVLIIFIVMLVVFRKEEPDVLPLKNRIGGIALGAEWVNTKQAIDALVEKVRKNPDDMKSKVQLAQAYVQEARITGDYNYYDLASIKLLTKVLDKEPNNFEAITTLATVYLSQHHFKDGLDLGRKAQKLAPHTAFVYGVLTDAYVELGKYDSAVIAVDSMCAVRPDLRSYSRISYVREIFGDIDGAKEAMKMAVEAGMPGMEQTEWVRVYLGRLYEMTGDIDTAEFYYQTAYATRGNYAYAIAGLGRVERAKKNYQQSIKYFEQAASLVNDYTFGDELIDLYHITNQKQKADSISKEVINLLNAHANANEQNKDAGHYADKELAYVYLKMNENDLALKHAEAEYQRRPDNNDINEMMAWVYYKRGEFDKAVPYVEKAMRTGSKNPVLLCRAGLVYCKSGNQDKGIALLEQATKMNPYLDEELMIEAIAYLPKKNGIVASS